MFFGNRSKTHFQEQLSNLHEPIIASVKRMAGPIVVKSPNSHEVIIYPRLLEGISILAKSPKPHEPTFRIRNCRANIHFLKIIKNNQQKHQQKIDPKKDQNPERNQLKLTTRMMAQTTTQIGHEKEAEFSTKIDKIGGPNIAKIRHGRLKLTDRIEK